LCADIFVVDDDIESAIATLRRRSYDARETLRRRALIGSKPSRQRRMKRFYHSWDPYMERALQHWPLVEPDDGDVWLAARRDPALDAAVERIRSDRESSPVERD
jgi:hypothetical protein